MTPSRIPEAISQFMIRKAGSGNLRHIPARDEVKMSNITHTPIDLVSNDYLSLAARADNGEFDDLRESLARKCAFTSSASRLLSRRQDEYACLEDMLHTLYGHPALLYNSGYHANTGLVSALNVGKTLFVVDRLAHASIYDGLMIGRCTFERFLHNDMASLRKILERRHDEFDTIIVIVESVYSMDGDLAPLNSLAALRAEFTKMLLYVDEAHAVGVRGNRGLGLSEETGTIPHIDVLTGTFGKALASDGAFAICAPELHDFFINASRSFIFSTANPPLCAAWSREMLKRSLEMHNERRHLASISHWFATELSSLTGRDTGSQSQIIPLTIGDARQVVQLSSELRHAGFDALAIRRPTVPPKGERIRFSLSAGLTREQLIPLIDFLNGSPILSHH